ncbi:MAG: phosphomannomutase, partial [Acetobacter sp.]|nr:phosphomannomutase [Acetobacter sp.]
MSFSHQFEPTTLREYDIRGIVGKTLTSEDAFAIGRTFGSIVRRNGGKIMVVGYDGRLSSPMLEEALVQGAVECGLKIMRIGCGPTPMLYYASVALQSDGAIMVTGSHNPPDYNGFKMILAGKPFFGEQIRAMGQQSASGDVVPLEKGTLCDYS